MLDDVYRDTESKMKKAIEAKGERFKVNKVVSGP